MARKRANGEGNIRKRSDGRWEGRYTAETGKRIIKNVLKVHFYSKKSTENRSFRCFLKLLGGFEPPTSSLPKSPPAF